MRVAGHTGITACTTRGMLFEKVYDVATSGGRVPDPHGALLPVGDTVDVSTATYRNETGAAEPSAAWTGSDFDPSLACVYFGTFRHWAGALPIGPERRDLGP